MVTFVAVGLAACDSAPVNSSAEPDAALDPIVEPAVSGAPAEQVRIGPHSPKDPHAALTPEQHARVALQHLAEGRAALAMDTLNQAIDRYPEADQLYGIRGSLWLEQDNVAAALADLESAVRLAPDNPLHLTNRAQAYRKFDRISEALADLNRAIELDADLLSARFNRGALNFSQGDFDTALADFDRCIAVDPHAAAPYFNRAAVYDALGKRAEAIADLQRFLEIAPSEEWKQTATELIEQWQSTPGPAGEPDAS